MIFCTRNVLLLLFSALSISTPTANAYEPGDWIVRVGTGTVDPKSGNGAVVSVDSGTTLVFNATYMFSSNVGIELLAAAPFSHAIKLAADGTKVGETKHLPPTLSLQYHFDTEGTISPYVGAGINYTLFFDEKTSGPLQGLALDLEPSFGIAAQAGLDYAFAENMRVNVDLRWMNIETDADVDGTFLETVEIDPLVYSLTFGWKF